MLSRIGSGAIGLFLLCGCAAQPSYLPHFGLEWHAAGKRLLIMPPDIRMSRITVDGTAERLPDEETAATATFLAHIEEHLSVGHVTATQTASRLPEEQKQFILLYSALTMGPRSIGTRADLRKRTALRDSLGPGTEELAAHYGADYALFFSLRDTSTSGGRVLINLAADAALALLSLGRIQQPVSEARREASLALVDLHSGNVQWSTSTTDVRGDLTDTEDTARITTLLLKDIPL